MFELTFYRTAFLTSKEIAAWITSCTNIPTRLRRYLILWMQILYEICGSNTCNSGVLNLFPFEYPRVIKQSTRTPRLPGKAGISHCCITTTQDQAKSKRSFQSARIFLQYRILRNSNTWQRNCHPSTPGNLPVHPLWGLANPRLRTTDVTYRIHFRFGAAIVDDVTKLLKKELECFDQSK